MEFTHLFPLALGFGLILGLSLMKARSIPSKALALFRVAVPSWRFFDELGAVPALYYRYRIRSHQNQNALMGPWMIGLENTSRHWSALFLNSRGNLRMACNSLLEQLIEDLNSADRLSESTSYLLTRNLVQYQILRTLSRSWILDQSLTQKKVFEFQFKVKADSEDLFLSSTHEININLFPHLP